MLAAAPVVLPLLALYASRQRERLASAADSAVQLARLEALLVDLQGEAADELAAEMGEEVAEALRAAQAAAARAVATGSSSAAAAEAARAVAKLEAKLSAVEGSVLSTGAATREALAASAEKQGQMASSVMQRLQDLGTALRRDVNGALAAAGSEEAAAFGRLEARLESLEGSITALQGAQQDGLRRLNTGLAAAVDDASATLQAAVADEAYRSLEPLRRLPELMQAAVPVTPEVLLGPDRALPSLSEEGLRLLLGEQLGAATRQLAAQQEQLLEEIRSQPQEIAPQQWNQLGGRLAFLQEQLEGLAAVQAAQPASAGGGGAPAEVAAVAAELAGLRSELGSLAGSVRQLLEAQQAQQAAGPASFGGGGSGGGGGAAAPPGLVAAVAAALQAVQDQVVMLRQDCEESDPRYATLAGIEQQLEVALTALFESLASQPLTPAAAAAAAGGSGGSGDAAAAASAAQSAAAAAAAVEQQQAALAAALDGLAALGGRLDGLSGQLASLQASAAAAAPAPQPVASPSAEQADAAAPAEPAVAALPAGAEAEDGWEAAYRRMQQLLQQPADADASPESSGKAFAEWLGGHRENAAVPAGAGGGDAAAVGNGAGGVQQQIEFATALGMLPGADAEGEAAAGGDIDGWGIVAMTQAEQQLGQQQQAWAEQQQEQWAEQPWQAQEEKAQQAWAQQPEQQQQAWAQQPEQQQQVQQQPQQQPEQQPQPEQQRQAAQPAAQQPASQQQQLPPEQLYERGVQRLREGRALAAAPGGDLGRADAAFWEAADAWEALLAAQPGNVRALGNYGNTLLAHGKLKKQMMEAVAAAAPPADAAQAAAVAAARARLAGDAEELLLLAGRKYRAVLEQDADQAKALINWGRVLGLRAEMAAGQGNLVEGARLFGLAADKFDAALDLEPQNAQALRLAAQALLEGALCTLPADAREARSQLKDAASYFQAALAAEPADSEAAAGLARCQAELDALRVGRGQQ
ncbi:hypothetical protein C2E20_1800 [Micractinium conductrix]|uniref:Uncharacterized protein n=1 Tax=Micractinium conductrix TaxID=554055 RepID=A0A2P6VLF7_9CHLO|nr:hypothetical protein C2E20_1800 [Micractinium conductrix]|eukprot:PSC74895.1 hypothetical protein C2E20_1800 [Micractinium conductrix]